MRKVPITPLDGWIADQLPDPKKTRLSTRAIRCYQLSALNETLAHAAACSSFHARRLGQRTSLGDLDSLSGLPFTTSENLCRYGQEMLCVSQDAVARIMTLESSGTTGPPKRVYFSDEDIERILDFFHHGMATIVGPGHRVLILLPGETPDSTGDLLARALERLGARAIPHGLAKDTAAALDHAHSMAADCLVGFPVQILGMARLDAHTRRPAIRLRPNSVLLCSDYAPDALVADIARIWGSNVLTHWGSTETGLGGGVECRAACGCHLRQADLIVEIIDPATGKPLPDGTWGEVVVTTLNRQAMPFIRYRTGDTGRLLPGTCPCGSVVARLDKVPGRIGATVTLANGNSLRLAALDAILFRMEGVMDFTATVYRINHQQILAIRVALLHGDLEKAASRVRRLVAQLPEMNPAKPATAPVVDVQVEHWRGTPYFPAKRTWMKEINI